MWQEDIPTAVMKELCDLDLLISLDWLSGLVNFTESHVSNPKPTPSGKRCDYVVWGGKMSLQTLPNSRQFCLEELMGFFSVLAGRVRAWLGDIF